jgi:Lon protease-like protein
MSDLLPIFPLPNVVLFPNVFLPLHIFEPRYRDMVADALSADRLIGMVLLRPGWESDYEGRPPVYRTGCSGVITHAERLPDGRYNIVLRGLERFGILDEDHGCSYRRALIEPLSRRTNRPRPRRIRNCRTRLDRSAPAIEHGPARRTSASTRKCRRRCGRDLVNALSQCWISNRWRSRRC